MDNADFFTTFFGWLGAELTPFPDVPTASEQLGTVDFGGDKFDVSVTDDDLSLDRTLPSGRAIGARMLDNDGSYIAYSCKDGYFCGITIQRTDSGLRIMTSNGQTTVDGVSYYLECKQLATFDGWSKWSTTTNYIRNLSDYSDLVFSQNCLVCFEDGSATLGYLNTTTGVWSGDDVFSSAGSSAADLTVIGQDAQYDDAGNITDYGNVTVPDVFAPNYTAPGSYAEALNQMNATATTENPAHVDSPTFGQGDTSIKDWVDGNQTPKPDPSDETAQDGFKVEDLEKVFPFCIPWDVYYLLSMLAAEPVAPLIEFPLNFSNFGLDDYSIRVDFGEYESFAVVLRAVEALSFCVGLALVTRNLVRG